MDQPVIFQPGFEPMPLTLVPTSLQPLDPLVAEQALSPADNSAKEPINKAFRPFFRPIGRPVTRPTSNRPGNNRPNSNRPSIPEKYPDYGNYIFGKNGFYYPDYFIIE